jgi:hypothetical protein
MINSNAEANSIGRMRRIHGEVFNLENAQSCQKCDATDEWAWDHKHGHNVFGHQLGSGHVKTSAVDRINFQLATPPAHSSHGLVAGVM